METDISIIVFALSLIVAVVTIAGMWKAFAKAGESGWKALIPIYNVYIMLRIAGHSGWWLAVIVLPLLPQLYLEFGLDPSTLQPGPGGLEQMGAMFGALIAFFIAFMVFFVIALIVQTVILYDIARSFGKGLCFTIGLTLLPVVFWPILGFGNAKYRGPVAHPRMVGKGTGAHIETNNESNDEDKGDEESDESDYDEENDHPEE